MEQVTRQNTAIADFLQKKKKTYAKSANANNFIHKGWIILFTKALWWNLLVWRKQAQGLLQCNKKFSSLL